KTSPKTPGEKPNKKQSLATPSTTIVATNESSNQNFPVFGDGASAEGLEAFSQLLSALPANLGMAFVVVPHLDPSHESVMTELLARQTTMPVLTVHDGMRVRPNHVYVLPPNAEMTINDSVLRLSNRRLGGQ